MIAVHGALLMAITNIVVRVRTLNADTSDARGSTNVILVGYYRVHCILRSNGWDELIRGRMNRRGDDMNFINWLDNRRIIEKYATHYNWLDDPDLFEKIKKDISPDPTSKWAAPEESDHV